MKQPELNMLEQANIIAIDGPAASGKGTLSRNLAKALNFAHMDTGALYRAVAYEVLQTNKNPSLLDDALSGCDILQQKLKTNQTDHIFSNPALRTETIGEAASKLSVIQDVRDRLIDIQRSFATAPGDDFAGAILDGRDIGTVICPDALLKLYITAKTEIRAQRRMKELQSKGLEVTYEAVLKDMRARDARDSGRKAAPLKPAEDAIIIDSSALDEDQMLDIALTHAKDAFGRIAV